MPSRYRYYTADVDEMRDPMTGPEFATGVYKVV